MVNLLDFAADSLRYFVLQHYGGVYLDTDVECYTPMDAWLTGHDLVLQSEYGSGDDVTNGMMASVPQHEFWELVIKIMRERSPSISGKSGDETNADEVTHLRKP